MPSRGLAFLGKHSRIGTEVTPQSRVREKKCGSPLKQLDTRCLKPSWREDGMVLLSKGILEHLASWPGVPRVQRLMCSTLLEIQPQRTVRKGRATGRIWH